MTSGKLAEILKGELLGSPDVAITGISAIDQSRPGDLTFIRNTKFAQMWERSKASVAIVVQEVGPPKSVAEGRAIILVADADVAQLAILTALAPPTPEPKPGVDPTAKVDPSASIDPTARVGPMCVVGARAKIGARSNLVSGVHIGEDATVGTDTEIGPGSSILDRCVVGNNCHLAGCVVIGAEGFGYTLQAHPSGRGKYLVHFPHIGNVNIGDHVDIGANTCIDRAKFGSTSIGSGTKIDNLVQIAHNVVVGEHNILVAQVGIAGSTTLGRYVMVGGQAGLADHLQIGDQVMIAAKSGVTRSLEPNQIVSGAPVMAHATFLKAQAVIPQLPELRNRVRELEERLATLEQAAKPAAKTRKPRRK